MSLFGHGVYMQAKAWLAQVLIEQAWQTTLKSPNKKIKPWFYADSYPVAQIIWPKHNKRLTVLDGASGRNLAFAPSHFLPAGELGGADFGNSQGALIAGHNDTHFAFLKNAKVGEQFSLKIIDSEKIALSSAEIKFEISDLQKTTYQFKLSNSAGDELLFGYDHSANEFFINRSKAGQVDFSEEFASKVSTAPRISTSKKLDGTIILDNTSIELFFDGGKTVMTEIFFPNHPWQTLSVEAKDVPFTLNEIQAYQLTFN